MLPKENRLSRKDFLLLKKHKPIVSGKYFSLVVLLSEDFKTSKFAILISKKNLKGAVDRNKVKRIFYDELSGIISKLSKNVYAIFILRKNVINKSKEEILYEVEKTFKKIKLLE